MKIEIKRQTVIKVAVMVLVPPILMGAASLVLDPAVVHKVMIYGAPLALLPLALKWLRRRARRRAAAVAEGGEP